MVGRIDFPAPRGALARAVPCSRCGARILFWPHARTGSRMPLDLSTAVDDPANPVVVRMESHFARCPSAASFRRRPGPRGEGPDGGPEQEHP